MGRYLLLRIGGLAAVILVVSIVTFVLMHLIPGGPYDEDKMPLSPEAKANILRSYGLDKPLWEQYVRYIGNAVRFEFGYSYQSPGETVAELIARVWTVSLHLGALTLALAIPVGLLLGTVAARRQNSWVDSLVTFLATTGIVLPHFVLGILLILFFSNTLHKLPTGGWEGPKTWVMPVIAYALGPAGVIARYTRISIIETLGADYVRTARAKGLAENRIMRRHVLRNAAIPILTVVGPLVPDLLTGSIFIETIFRIPGLGSYFVTSIFTRDYPMIMTLALLAACVVSLAYLAVDLLYLAVDPRIRLER
ncbi:MAG: oligopeptide transport system permease protein [Thermomicrobiales bacterium]|nr:oligopeptide transport system permease protein [Thermomicrobiales bacterium]MEA2526395.1 oligopeptide transport system permease protein [Thermomicrobiales bacterium]MEA2597681.1 oligopeptide transport system permease protein [Thermomicrobiales bacterium]